MLNSKDVEQLIDLVHIDFTEKELALVTEHLNKMIQVVQLPEHVSPYSFDSPHIPSDAIFFDENEVSHPTYQD